MSPPAERPSSPVPVTIGLLDGRRLHGVLTKPFSPYEPKLVLEPHRAVANSVAITTEAAVHELAFVATLRHPKEPFSTPTATNLVRVSVAVVGGERFSVLAAPGGLSNPLGFFGAPAEGPSPHKRIFFFAQAVLAKQEPNSLGQMLVKEGLVSEEQLQQGLKAQSEQRAQPLGEILVEQKKVTPEAVDQAHQLAQRKRLRIGEILVELGLVTKQDVDNALTAQKEKRGKRLGQVMVEMGMVSEQNLCATLAKKFHLPFVDLNEIPVDPEAAQVVPMELIEKYRFLPIARDEKGLTIAISDPLRTEIHDILRFQMGKNVTEVLATATQIDAVIGRMLAPAPVTAPSLEAWTQGLDVPELEEPPPEPVLAESDSEVVRMANQIIADGVHRGASDIHIEPNGAARGRIRFRVDGDCEMYQEIPGKLALPLVSRLKIMAALDISEKRKPQDGKIKLRLPEREVELRMASIPTVNGNEDVVLRILASSKPRPLSELAFSERNLRVLREIVEKPYGLILCVGPTGSGKTTTLHSALGSINTPDRKIWTAEDPVEIVQPGLRQVQVNAKIGMNFATTMRAFLRADPDVIMIGEMRDVETASTAVEASLTGHLVFSTLHTNSAPETITRLLDMGLDPFTFADALVGVLAQRLARALCPDCRFQEEATQEEFDQLMAGYGAEAAQRDFQISKREDFKAWRGKGCAACRQSGYRGRVGLHELLTGEDEVKKAVQRKAPIEEIRRMAISAGMTTLFQDGVAKAMAGVTDLRQVQAVAMH